MSRLTQLLREEGYGLSLHLALATLLVGWLPPNAGQRLRAFIYRLVGIPIGSGTVVLGRMRITGKRRCVRQLLHVGCNAVLNDGVHFDLGGHVHLDDNVSIGMDCLFITASHQIGSDVFRAGDEITGDIRVERGAWLGGRVTVLPDITIGRGAVVAAGAVVTRDVLPNTVVAGIPAKPIRDLPVVTQPKVTP